MDSIFTITAAGDDVQHMRTWGWYPTYEEAEKHVLFGDDLLLEGGTFKYLLIEEVPVGCPTLCETAKWFQAHCVTWYEDGKPCRDYRVVPCDPPSWAKNTCAFSMG